VCEVLAEEVSIDPSGRLIVRPQLPTDADFAFIYRAAMEVSWDPTARTLVTPTPRNWSAARWFEQVAGAVHSEYGKRLVVTPRTRWREVPPDARSEIETRFSQKPAV
jgi:hypothetical protein